MVIPRDDADLIKAIVTRTMVPTIEAGIGSYHIYIDASADTDETIALTINGKARRPGVCNITEMVLTDSTLST